MSKSKLRVYKPKEHIVIKVELCSCWVQNFLFVLREFFTL